MKYFFTIALAAMVSGMLFGQHRFDFKSGMIEYRIEGNINGTEIIYFDDFGKLYYDDKTTTEDTGKKKRELHIEKNDSVFTYTSNQKKPVLQPIDHQADRMAKNRITATMLKEMGFKPEGTEKAGNVLCEKYVSDNTELWIWNHIIIKSQIEIMDMVLKKEAVKIETGIRVPRSQFDFSTKNFNNN